MSLPDRVTLVHPFLLKFCPKVTPIFTVDLSVGGIGDIGWQIAAEY